MLDLLTTKKAAVVSTANGAVSRETVEGIVAVPLVQILDNPYQPRAHYDAEHILKLATSIKRLKHDLPATTGLQQVPLARLVMLKGGEIDVAPRHVYAAGNAQRLVQTRPDAAVQLMFGHSRLRAFMVLSEGLRSLRHNQGTAIGMDFAGVTDIETRYAELMDADLSYAMMPLMVAFALDHAMWQHAITENSQRKNINAIEEAQSIQRAIDEFGLSTEEAGRPFGYERSTTANKVRLLKLPAEVQKQIADGELSERHGRELLRVVADPERVRRLARDAIKKGQPVRQLAEQVNWEEKALKEVQEKERQWEAARAALAAGWRPAEGASPILPERVVDVEEWKLHGFVATEPSHVALLQTGKCGAHCACLIAAYSPYRGEKCIRPDPANAPHVCLACIDPNERRTKLLSLGALGLSEEERQRQATAAERKRKAEALSHEAHAVWQRWLRGQNKHALWNSIAFWKVVARYTWRLDSILNKAPDVPEACTQILLLFYQGTRDYDQDLNEHVHTVAAVEKLIAALAGAEDEAYAGIEQIVDEGDDDE